MRLGYHALREMRMRLGILLVASATLCAAFASEALSADGARGGGIQLDLPSGWSKVVPARPERVDDPRTVLVIGTRGVEPIETVCQVYSYRVPADGAAVVVIGWREAVGGSSFFPLGAMKLRRGTFECYPGRGAVGRVTRRDRDYQVNVMVGDRADQATVDAALAAARSIAPVTR